MGINVVAILEIIIWPTVILAIFYLLVIYIKSGFRVSAGSLNVAVKDKLSKEDVDKLVDEHIMKEFQHLVTLEGVKDAMRAKDDHFRAILSRKFDDIPIPTLPSRPTKRSDSLSKHVNKLDSQVFILTVRLYLVILNTENHYFHAIASQETLEKYLIQRYIQLKAMVFTFAAGTDWLDDEWSLKTTKEIALNWWAIVRSELMTVLQDKRDYIESLRGIFSDTTYEERGNKLIEGYIAELKILDEAPSYSNLIDEYLDSLDSDEEDKDVSENKSDISSDQTTD